MPRRFRPALIALTLAVSLGLPATRAADWASGEVVRHASHPDRLLDGVARIGRLDGVYSVLVAHRDQLIAESYFREGSRDKPHNLKSASKSVISALVGIAIAEGSLGLDQSIAELLPEARALATEKGAITVRHLLSMTSGLEPTSYEGYGRWIESSNWVAAALEEPLVAHPGEVFQYSTANTHLLSAVLTAATGRSTRRYAEERLFEPIGVTVRGWETDPRGIHVGGNNLSLTPREMARFGQLYLRGGRWGDRQVVPSSWVAESTRTTRRGLHRVYGTYGYLWWTDLIYEGAFAAVGFGGQYIYVSPPHDAVVVVTSTLESKGEAWTVELFDALRNQILAALGPDPDYYRGRPPSDPALASLASALDRARRQVAALETPWTDLEAFEPRRARTLARVNLRQEPNTESPRLAVVEHGAAIEVLELSQPWLRARAKGLEGWVHADYVRLDEISWRRAAADLRRDLELLSRAIEPHLDDALANGGDGEAAPPDIGASPLPGAGALARMEDQIADLQARLEASLAEREEASAAVADLTARLEATARALDVERTRTAELSSRSEAQDESRRRADEARESRWAEELGATERQTAAAQAALDRARLRIAELESELGDERRRAATAEASAAESLETELRIAAEGGQRAGEQIEALRLAVEEAEAGRRRAEENLETERRIVAKGGQQAGDQIEALRLAVEEAEKAQRRAEDSLETERRIAAEGDQLAGEQTEALRVAVEEAEAAQRRAEESLETERRTAAEGDQLAGEQIEALRLAVGQAEAGRRRAEESLETERRTAAEGDQLAGEQIEALRLAVEEAEAGRRRAEENLETERRIVAKGGQQAGDQIEALRLAVEEAEKAQRRAEDSLETERRIAAEGDQLAGEQTEALRVAVEEAEAAQRRAEESLETERRTAAKGGQQAGEQIEALRLAVGQAEEAQRRAEESLETERGTAAEGGQRAGEQIEALRLAVEEAEAGRRRAEEALGDTRSAATERERQADEQIEILQAALKSAERRQDLAEEALEEERPAAAERQRQIDLETRALRIAAEEAETGQRRAEEALEDERLAATERERQIDLEAQALRIAVEEAEAGRRRVEEARENERVAAAERLRQADDQIEALRAAVESAEARLSQAAAERDDRADAEEHARISSLEASLAAAENRSRDLASELDDLRAAWLEQQIELEDARRAARLAGPPRLPRPPQQTKPRPEPPRAEPSRPDLAAYLAAWLEAWASGSVSDYLASYADDYPVSDPAERARWAAQAMPSPRPTEVRLRDLETSDPEGPAVRVRFLLEYRIGPRTISTTKLLDLVRTADSWRIRGETPRP